MQAHMAGIQLEDDEMSARRQPAVERSIGEITEKDFRIRVLGFVVERNEARNAAMIDDGTGRAIALFSSTESFSKALEGTLVRVFGRVRHGEFPEIEVELLQDMSGLDRELYEQVRLIAGKIKGSS